MQETVESISFRCPGCNGTFEFDLIGEHELVLCPICGTEFMTTRKGQTLLLEHFEFVVPEAAPLP